MILKVAVPKNWTNFFVKMNKWLENITIAYAIQCMCSTLIEYVDFLKAQANASKKKARVIGGTAMSTVAIVAVIAIQLLNCFL